MSLWCCRRYFCAFWSILLLPMICCHDVVVTFLRGLESQCLLSSDHVSYKIRPIAGYSDLVDANEELIVGNDTVRMLHFQTGSCQLPLCMRYFGAMAPDCAAAEPVAAFLHPQVKSIVMINCGGPVELSRFLDLSEDQVCYVVDCNKPAHHTNVHSEKNVSVLPVMRVRGYVVSAAWVFHMLCTR